MNAVEARDLFRLYAIARGHVGRAAGTDDRRRRRRARSSSSARAARARARCCASSPGSTGRRRAPSASSATICARCAAGRSLDYRSRTLGYADQHYAPRARARAHGATARRSASRAARRRARGARTRRGRTARTRRPARPCRLRFRPSSPAASSSVSRSALRSPTGRGSSSPTSRPASSTPSNATQIYELIGELVARGRRDHGSSSATIPSSAAIADRVVQIRDGRVSAEDGDAVVNRGGWVRIPEELLGGASACADRPDRSEGSSCASTRATMLRLRYRSSPPTRRSRREHARAREVATATASVFADSPLDVRVRPALGCDRPLRLGQVDVPASARGSRPADGGRGARARRADLVARRDRACTTSPRPHRGRDAGNRPRPVPHRAELEIALALRGVADRTRRQSLAAVGLEELAQQRVARLSMGERQRVAVARALAARPRASARRRTDRAPRRGERTCRRPALRRARGVDRARRSSARRTIPC